ncbi:DUF6538 domain-containing protein [Stutzerimonas stutzeri]|uniref:DUF6538 domain-containing protein n=1 Tax=Stutzerimonas stutzeri TaxID=316 RepID=UPI003D025C28
MAHDKLLVLRGTTYHVRMDVPKDVRLLLGKRVLTKSLKTSKLAEAKTRADYIKAQWRTMIADARGRLENNAWKIEAYDAMSKHREHYVLKGDLDGGDSLHDMISGQSEIFNQFIKKAFPGEIPQQLKKILHEEAHHAKFFGSPPKVDTFNEALIKKYLDHRLKEVEITTAERDCSDLRQFREFMESNCYGFAKETVAHWINELDVLPVVKRRKLHAGKAFIEFVRELKHFPSGVANPFDGIKIAKQKKKDAYRKPRQGFLKREVETLYDAAVKSDKLLASFIAIAAYTGMRAEEIARITKQDIYLDEGGYVITIPDQNAKTESGVRLVPVHKSLEPLVISLKDNAGDDGYILAYETKRRIEKRSGMLVSRFSLLKRSLKMPATKTFHSFRHTVIGLLEKEQVLENITADIVGHKKTTMSYGLYSAGTATAHRHEAINKIIPYSFDLGLLADRASLAADPSVIAS